MYNINSIETFLCSPKKYIKTAKKIKDVANSLIALGVHTSGLIGFVGGIKFIIVNSNTIKIIITLTFKNSVIMPKIKSKIVQKYRFI
jgi:hypothetical protein